MTLATNYLVTYKNMDKILNAIIGAQAPEKFTQTFLEGLGFTSSNDRLYIGLLKALRFIDDGGAPTQRYFDFLDQSRSKKVMANAIRESYSDIFQLKRDAHLLEVGEIKNKLKTLTQGKKSDDVVGRMAGTFKALCDYADWSEPESTPLPTVQPVDEAPASEPIREPTTPKHTPSLHYNIQIHLPEARDQTVYDAIFKSIKEHLLK